MTIHHSQSVGEHIWRGRSDQRILSVSLALARLLLADGFGRSRGRLGGGEVRVRGHAVTTLLGGDELDAKVLAKVERKPLLHMHGSVVRCPLRCPLLLLELPLQRLLLLSFLSQRLEHGRAGRVLVQAVDDVALGAVRLHGDLLSEIPQVGNGNVAVRAHRGCLSGVRFRVFFQFSFSSFRLGRGGLFTTTCNRFGASGAAATIRTTPRRRSPPCRRRRYGWSLRSAGR